MNSPTFWMAVLAALLATSGLQAAPAERRPNFLLIIADDQRYDAMSCVQKEQGEKARFPWIDTPNMDRLAREGVRFRNAFVVNSLCSPSRASILTGRHGFLNGVVNNRREFPAESVTYASLMRQAGYRTGYIGKWHMGQQSGQRPGFDFSASYVGQGKYTDYPFEINGVSTPTKGWVDDVSTDFALQFLRENKGQPFVLTVGFKSPHGPSQPPPRLANYYGKPQARTVPNLSIPAIFLGAPDYATAVAEPPGWKNENVNYHRTVRGADEDLGRLLDELDRLGLAENTFVIFTSDNGLFHGEHRLGDKRAGYEESMRVPMLVRFPKLGLRGVHLDADVLNLDIPETMLDYAGIKIPDAMQGRSWRSLFEAKADLWRTAFFYSYFQENDYPRIPTLTAVRTSHAKLLKYPGHEEWTELFDLRNDPFEINNLASQPSELRQEMEKLYASESKAAGFLIPPFADDPKNNKKGAQPHRKKSGGEETGSPFAD